MMNMYNKWLNFIMSSTKLANNFWVFREHHLLIPGLTGIRVYILSLGRALTATETKTNLNVPTHWLVNRSVVIAFVFDKFTEWWTLLGLVKARVESLILWRSRGYLGVYKVISLLKYQRVLA